MKDKFRNKNGSLTAYAFHCGYTERFHNAKGKAQLAHSLGSYDVESYSISDGLTTRVHWECFASLTEARKCYREQVRKFKTKPNENNPSVSGPIL